MEPSKTTTKLNQGSGVPTNIITGFLGVGKTSAILELLKNKPKDERWAVLVNEFGDIGIDGALFTGQHLEEQGIYVREVPGGCMCCTAGLLMQAELSELLERAKPDRLLIEPTGLGHPQEVLKTLSDDRYHGVLAIQKIITLVDARHLKNRRYLYNPTYQQQLDIADVIVANKQDLYSDDNINTLKAYLQDKHLNDAKLVFTEQGILDLALLDGLTTAEAEEAPNAVLIKSHESYSNHAYQTPEIPECGYIKTVNQDEEGYVSVGWRFSSQFWFDQEKLRMFLSNVNAQRLKATLITNNGSFAYNLARDDFSEVAYEGFSESRIEIIAWYPNRRWEQQLFDCFDDKVILNQNNC